MRKSVSIILTIAIALGLFSCNSAFQPSLKLEKGKVYSVEMRSEQKISQTIQDIQQNIEQTNNLKYDLEVLEALPDKNFLVKLTYTSIYAKQTSPRGTVEYDSSKPETQVAPAFAGYAALFNHSLEIVFKPNGEVAEVRKMGELIDKMLNQMNLPQGPESEQVKKMISDQFGEEAMKEMIGQSSAIYPDKPIKVGESWTKTITLSKGFPMKITNKWTLKKRKGGISYIDMLSSVSQNDTPLEFGVVKIKYNISGSMSGQMEMQEKSGLATKATINQKMSGTVTIEPNAQLPQGMSWPISIEGMTSFNIVER